MPRFPFGIPNSWYLMAYSDELAPGAVLPLHFLDRDLVAFRSDAGEAAVLDAHCPHLGTHLGVGGTVVGDTLLAVVLTLVAESRTQGAARSARYGTAAGLC